MVSSWTAFIRVHATCSFSYRDPLYTSSMTILTGGLSTYRHPYFDVYHRYFQRFRGANVTILEIGIQV